MTTLGSATPGNLSTGRWPWYRFALAAGLLGAVVSFMTLFVLGFQARHQIDNLATSNSDTLHWSMSQGEVELLSLSREILEAQSDPDRNLAGVRKAYDVFFSRVNTYESGAQFFTLRAVPEAMEDIGQLRSFLERTVPVIDGPDDALFEALPDLLQETFAARQLMRELSLIGVRLFSEQSDDQREAVSDLLTRIAALTVMLVVMLISLVIVVSGIAIRSRRSEQALEKARRHSQTVISTSLDGIVVVDVKGRVIDYNGAAEKIFGYARADVIGQPMHQMIIPEKYRAAHQAGMSHYLRTGERKVVGAGLVQLEALRADGSLFPVEFSISSVEGDDGEIFVSYIRDISERVTQQQELIAARDSAVAGDKAKSDFLAVMSHEMRTPLNGLIGALDLLENTSLTPEQRRLHSVMLTSGHLLLHHINGVLDISKADSGNLEIASETLNVSTLIGELIESQRASLDAKGNSIHWEVDPRLNAVVSDPMRLRQILLNLIGNANKFTDGSEIFVEAEYVSEDGTARFRVIDTGIGIAEENLGRVFEDFQTLDATYGRRTEGTGLGLAISRRLVHAMGGEIGVESEVGEGSLFWVHIPMPLAEVDSAAVEVEPASEEEQPAPVQGLSILVVEDNEINRLIVREMLAGNGHQVTEAVNGALGVDAALRERFDLILMDISMPELDGVGATEMIRATDGPNKRTPIVAVTAHATPEDNERFQKAGMNRTITKPIRKKDLDNMLSRIFSRTPTRDEQPRVKDATPHIDQATVEQLLETLGNERCATLVEAFALDIDAVLAEVGGGQVSSTEAADKVHKSAGSAAVFGAMALRKALVEAEDAFRAGAQGDGEAAVETAKTLWSETKPQLFERLGAQG